MGVITFKKDTDFNVCSCSSHIFITEQYISPGKKIFLLQNSIYHREEDQRKDDGWTVVKESGYVVVSCEFVGTGLINLFEREFVDDDGCDMLFCFCW